MERRGGGAEDGAQRRLRGALERLAPLEARGDRQRRGGGLDRRQLGGGRAELHGDPPGEGTEGGALGGDAAQGAEGAGEDDGAERALRLGLRAGRRDRRRGALDGRRRRLAGERLGVEHPLRAVEDRAARLHAELAHVDDAGGLLARRGLGPEAPERAVERALGGEHAAHRGDAADLLQLGERRGVARVHHRDEERALLEQQRHRGEARRDLLRQPADEVARHLHAVELVVADEGDAGLHRERADEVELGDAGLLEVLPELAALGALPRERLGDVRGIDVGLLDQDLAELLRPRGPRHRAAAGERRRPRQLDLAGVLVGAERHQRRPARERPRQQRRHVVGTPAEALALEEPAEVVGELLRGAVALRRLPRQGALEHLPHRRRHVGDLGQAGHVEAADEGERVRAGEERLAREQLVEEHAGEEDVGARVDLAPHRLLGREVPRLDVPDHRGPGDALVGAEAREPEVSELHLAAPRDEHVRGVHVPVHDPERLPLGIAGGVEVPERVRHREDDRARLAQPDVEPARRRPLEDPPQVGAVHELHDEVRPAVRRDPVVEHADEPVVPHRRGEPRLAPEAPQRLRIVREPRQQPLHRHRPRLGAADGAPEEHLRGGPDGEAANEEVAAQGRRA